MNWKALLTYHCPQCEANLHYAGFLSDEASCTNAECDFKIGETRLQEVIKNMTRKRSRYEEKVELEMNGMPRL